MPALCASPLPLGGGERWHSLSRHGWMCAAVAAAAAAAASACTLITADSSSSAGHGGCEDGVWRQSVHKVQLGAESWVACACARTGWRWHQSVHGDQMTGLMMTGVLSDQ